MGKARCPYNLHASLHRQETSQSPGSGNPTKSAARNALPPVLHSIEKGYSHKFTKFLHTNLGEKFCVNIIKSNFWQWQIYTYKIYNFKVCVKTK